MYIEAVPNHGSKPTILLRESYREDGKVKKRTLANLTKLPPVTIEAIRQSLRGEGQGGANPPNGAGPDGFEIERSLPHGAVAAVLGTLRNIGLERLIDRKACRERDLVVAMIVDRLLMGESKLSTVRHCTDETATHTLGRMLELGVTGDEECYRAMDWLLARQGRIEARLAARHLQKDDLVMVDMSSSYFEGHCCPLAKRGHSRDRRGDLPQIVYGAVTNRQGCPVAVQVFEGNTSDHKAFPELLQTVQDKFHLKEAVLVGDRGMISGKAIDEYLRGHPGAHWITALTSRAIRQLLEQGAVQTTLLDEHDLVEIAHPDQPAERLVVCRNPLLAEERRRKREELLAATERKLRKIQERVRQDKRPLRTREAIGIAVGKVIDAYKMAKHLVLNITDEEFTWIRDDEKIRREAALDGLYVLRTDLAKDRLSAQEVVISYKQLANVEKGFRALKSMDLRVRPIRHHLEDRVRAHVFLCMLAYYVEFHMREKLTPLLFHDECIPSRENPVTPATRSEEAKAKDLTKRNRDGEPLCSFEDLMRQLATLTLNKVVWCNATGKHEFWKLTIPTPLQKKVFSLLEVDP